MHRFSRRLSFHALTQDIRAGCLPFESVLVPVLGHEETRLAQ